MLIAAIIAITSALAFYTVGVWSEKISGTLKKYHLILFWVGLIFDMTGTTLMAKLANDVFSVNFHSITGLAAILLMMIHAIWATAVLWKNREEQKKKFHKFSILVWFLWLVPFLSGMIFGMMK